MQALKSALNKSDAAAILKVVASHTWEQRLELATEFQKEFNAPLDAELEAKLTGDAQKLIRALFKDKFVFWAETLRDLLKGKETDDSKLIAPLVFVAGKPQDRDRLIAAYETVKTGKRDLYDEIESTVSLNAYQNRPDWRAGRVTQALLKANYMLSKPVDEAVQIIFDNQKGDGISDDNVARCMCHMPV